MVFFLLQCLPPGVEMGARQDAPAVLAKAVPARGRQPVAVPWQWHVEAVPRQQYPAAVLARQYLEEGHAAVVHGVRL